MTDIERAKDILKNSGATCVLVSGDTVYTSDKSGIAPMMYCIAQKTDLKGFAAADKIIGKAAAMLFALAGVSDVYGEVLSRAAVPVLDENKIRYSYSTLTDKIINRTGDGICPMEQTVMNLTNPEQAYNMLAEKISQLRGKATDNR